MTLNPVEHDELVIERNLKASPERVFAAWADPAQTNPVQKSDDQAKPNWA